MAGNRDGKVTDANGNSTNGTSSTVAAIIAAIGLLGVMKPSLVWLGPLASHKDELATILPPILTVVGGVWAWLSHPPAWIKGPISDAAFFVRSFFRKRPTP